MTEFLNAVPASLLACQQRISAVLTLVVYADAAAAATGPGTVDPDIGGWPGGGLHSHATAQLFTLAVHLFTHRAGVDEDVLAQQLATAPWPDTEGAPVSGTQRTLNLIAAGRPWWQAAASAQDGQGSYGSDAAVRAVAAGLLPEAPIPAVAQLARRSALVTHTHPVARDAAAVAAAGVALAGGDSQPGGVDPEKFLEQLAGICRNRSMRAQLRTAQQVCSAGTDPVTAGQSFGSGSAAHTATGAALAAFLRHPCEPFQAVRFALAMGPQFAPAAVITAAIGAAANPHIRPPLTFVLAADVREQIATVAAGLAATAGVVRAYRRLAGSFVTQPS